MSTPPRVNMSVIAWVIPCSGFPNSYGAPAIAATSASPVASTTIWPSTSQAPAFVRSSMPTTFCRATRAPVTQECSSSSAPDSNTISCAANFMASGSNALPSIPPMLLILSQISVKNPPTSAFPVEVRDLMKGLTRPAVPSPPRNPYRSTSSVLAPDLAELTAAATPATPPPATMTS